MHSMIKLVKHKWRSLQTRTLGGHMNLEGVGFAHMYHNDGFTLLTFHQHHISIFVIQSLKIAGFYTCFFLQSTHLFYNMGIPIVSNTNQQISCIS